MKSTNSFIKLYTQIPDKQGIRKIILGAVILISIFNSCYIYYYYNAVLNLPIPITILKVYIVIILVFDLFSLIFYIFTKKMEKLTYLYGSIAFSGSSILNFFISVKILLNELSTDTVYLTISICLLIYIIIIISVIFNIRNKIKNNINKKPINSAFAGAISTLGIWVGIILSKQTESNNIIFGTMELLLSYFLIPTISGFHKFYLIIKSKDN